MNPYCEWAVTAACASVAVIAVASHRNVSSKNIAGSSADLALPRGAASSSALPIDRIDPSCTIEDRGFGNYNEWTPLPLGRALFPKEFSPGAEGGFDLIVHFHGAEAARKLLAPEMNHTVIVGVDAGIGSGAYRKALSDSTTFDALTGAVEREIASQFNAPDAHVERLFLSSWSAGYGAIHQLLLRNDLPIKSVILLDSLYAGYQPASQKIDSSTLLPFIDAAQKASSSDTLSFFLTYTEVPTYGYASSSETAQYILSQLGLSSAPTNATSSGSGEMIDHVQSGSLEIRGYRGNGKEDHCGQLSLLPEIFKKLLNQ